MNYLLIDLHAKICYNTVKNDGENKKMKKLAKILSFTLAIVMCAVVLTACGNVADSAKNKYEDANYTIETLEIKDLKTYGGSNEIKWAFRATKTENSKIHSATIVCLVDNTAAEEYASMAKKTPLVQVKQLENVVVLASSDEALNVL